MLLAVGKIVFTLLLTLIVSIPLALLTLTLLGMVFAVAGGLAWVCLAGYTVTAIINDSLNICDRHLQRAKR